MKISTATIRLYLTNVGREVSALEQLTQQEFGTFCQELIHKTGVLRTTAELSLWDIACVPKRVIDHIEAVLGMSIVTEPSSADEPTEPTEPVEPVAPVVAPVIEPVVTAPVVAPVPPEPVVEAPPVVVDAPPVADQPGQAE